MAILNSISKKRLRDFPIVYQQNKSFLKEHPRVSILFSPGFLGIYKRQICRKILDPLIPATKRILIYDLKNHRKAVQKYQPYLTKRHGRHIFNMKGKRWGYFMPLLYKPNILSTIHDTRGSILIQCENKNIPWETISEQSCGPFVFNNPSVGSGKAALNYAKRKFDDRNVFIIIDQINSGLESITITCHRDMITDFFTLAAKSCKLTSMLACEYAIIEEAEEERVKKSGCDSFGDDPQS